MGGVKKKRRALCLSSRCLFWRGLSPHRLSPQRTSPLPSNAGFTLLEVLVALALSGIMLAVLAGSYLESSRAQQIIAGRAAGLMLARSKMAELIGGSEKASSGEFEPPYRGYRWQSREEKSDAGAVALIITVEWRDGNDPPRHLALREYKNAE